MMLWLCFLKSNLLKIGSKVFIEEILRYRGLFQDNYEVRHRYSKIDHLLVITEAI